MALIIGVAAGRRCCCHDGEAHQQAPAEEDRRRWRRHTAADLFYTQQHQKAEWGFCSPWM